MGRTLFRACASRAVPVFVVALLAGEIRAADWPCFRVAGAGAGRNPFVLLEGGESLKPGQVSSLGVEVVSVSDTSVVLRWEGEEKSFQVGEASPSGALRKPSASAKPSSSRFKISLPDWPEERIREIGNVAARIGGVLLGLLLCLSLFLFLRRRSGRGPASSPYPPPRRRRWWPTPSDCGFEEHEGRILAVLPEDTIGIRHQRFLVRMENGAKTLLAHNIDLCPRIEGLEPGREIRFYGQFTMNDRGGVFHRLHRNRNPFHRYVDGWIEYDGTRYS
jgi:hypothetical protein